MISLKIARIQKGLTQKELASELGMSSATICRIEKGNIKISDLKVSTLKKIAEKLEIPVNELLENK